jgi:hypothetical protein
MSSRKKFEPELIIHVTRFGVVKVRIPYTTLSEESRSRATGPMLNDHQLVV